MSDKQIWIVRVVQEFKVEAKDANEAHAFTQKAAHRSIKGAILTRQLSACALADDDEELIGG